MLKTETRGNVAYTFNLPAKKKAPLRVFEAFAGVGSQRMALRNIGANFEVVGISEWDKNAIKSYQAIHGSDNEKDFASSMSEDIINQRLYKLGISKDGKNPASELEIAKMPIDEKSNIMNHIMNHKNFLSIVGANPEKIPDHDLFTYSFPCQDISVSGKQGGFEKDSGTRSGLLWECQKIIEAKKPKYLLLENVKNLVMGKHLDGFNKWLEWLEGQGYTNYWKILNSKDFGVPQSRERVFVVSVLGDHEAFEFPKENETPTTIQDVLEDEVEERYFSKKSLRRTRKRNYIQYDNSGKGYESQACRFYFIDGIMGTVPHSNSGDKTQICSLKKDGDTTDFEWARRMTPLEVWRIMGMSDEDFFKAQKVNSNIHLYKQAGNSIVVNVLEAIFEQVLKVDNRL